MRLGPEIFWPIYVMRKKKYYIDEKGLQARAGSFATPKRRLQLRKSSIRLNSNGVVPQTGWALPRLRAPLMVNLYRADAHVPSNAW